MAFIRQKFILLNFRLSNVVFLLQSLRRFCPHPFPVKGYRYFHNVGAALLAEYGFVLAVFDLLEGGIKRCLSGFAGTDFFHFDDDTGPVRVFGNHKNINTAIAGFSFRLDVVAVFQGDKKSFYLLTAKHYLRSLKLSRDLN
jgi:hypothetical protein